jgi:hypothetical protein
VLIGGSELMIRESGCRLLARVKQSANRLYFLTVRLLIVACLVMCEEIEAWCWHELLGHLNFPVMKKMVREQLCEAYLARKQKQSLFLVQAQCRMEAVLDLVHGILCGKISPPTPVGNE